MKSSFRRFHGKNSNILKFSKPLWPIRCLSQLAPSIIKEISLFLYNLRFITGSYDRTCKVWETETCKLLHTLEGHKNMVYCVAFNAPYG
jgi:WD40 repeat protein